MLAQENDYIACKDLFLSGVTYADGPLRYYSTAECLYDYVGCVKMKSNSNLGNCRVYE